MPHGYSQYTTGCRCGICKAAKAEYMRKRRAAARQVARPGTQRAATPGDWAVVSRYIAEGVIHGTRFAREERGCRCQPCTTKASELKSIQRRARRAA